MSCSQAADKCTLIVKAQDLNGSQGGNAATSTVTISIMDVNDNLPTLEMEKVEVPLLFFTEKMFCFVFCLRVNVFTNSGLFDTTV